MAKYGKVVVAMAMIVVGIGIMGDARAETVDFDVQVGAINPNDPAKPYEYTRYYPEELQIHRGQTVRFNFIENLPLGFHTVTFSSAGLPGYWRPDDVPGTYAFPDEGLLSSACGRGSQPACSFTSPDQFLSSGFVVNAPAHSPFRVTVDLPPGTYSYFCTIHATMTGTIEVVPDAAPLETQASIDALAAQQVLDDTANADALFQAGGTSRVTHENGQRVWHVLLGDSTDDDHVAIDTYLPASLPDVAPGDKVRFEFRERGAGPIKNEIHTVTFPEEIGVHGIALAFYPACDPDDPATGLKGIPGAWGVDGPECPWNTEFLWQPRITSTTPAPGNAVLTPATFHDSGAMIPPGAPESFRTLPDTGELRPVTFEAEFPNAGTFSFACSIHEHFMTGSVTVS